MIGYIKIYKPELKVREYNKYNAYYCGICKSLGREYGLVYRNLLNFDSVFLAIALDSLNEHEAALEKFRCILHPVKKKLRTVESSSISYVTHITVYMTYKKLLDDVEDENSVMAKISAGAFRGAYKKAREKIGGLADVIDSHLKRLGTLEKKGSDSIDETADCYGRIYGAVFSSKLPDSHTDKKAADWMGYNLGRWIYIADAFDDMEQDIKRKRYNPILNRFPYEKDEEFLKYKNSIKERLSFVMYSALDEASKAYDLIAKSVNSGIIRNILYEGLYSVTEKVLNGDCIDGTEKSL